jgi:hypothetical protein
VGRNHFYGISLFSENFHDNYEKKVVCPTVAFLQQVISLMNSSEILNFSSEIKRKKSGKFIEPGWVKK